MNLAELKTSLERGENLNTEFKQWPLQPDDLAAAIVAFANTDGGRILIGVDDRGQVAGINLAERDRIARTVDNVAYNNIQPPVTVILETLTNEQGLSVLVVNIPKGKQRPYRTNRGLYFVRTTSGKRQASREELLRIFQDVKSLFYDETPLLGTTTADIEAQARDDLLQMAREHGFDVATIELQRLLSNWKLLRRMNGESSLTIAGSLFLARNPQHWLPTAYISAVRIPGTEISIEPSDQKRIEGRLLNVIEDARRFLAIHLLRPHHIEGFEPEVTPELPVEMLREAIVNAVAHRDYTISGPIRILVFNDRVEIRTPGQLPNGVTLDDLHAGIHVLRNPMIYMMLLRIGLVTDVGSGIPRIIHLTRQTVGRDPEFRLVGPDFVLSLPRRNSLTAS
jgi:ATP-dependent DNA helicase RecG